MANSNPEPEESTEPGVMRDKSLTYMGIILAIIIMTMGYLTLFVDDPWKMFRSDKQTLKQETGDEQRALNTSLSMSDEEVRQSLVKFIEAFYYDQQKGYFDPPSYFAPITETFYNYHNLTYERLRDLYWKRRADMENFKRNWIVSSLDFKRDGNRIIATYWSSERFFRRSKREQQSVDVKYELITDENGKIVSLRELEARNFTSSPVEIDSIDSVIPANPTTTPPVAPPAAQPATVPPTDDKVYDAATVDHAPEFNGGAKKLINYLETNSRFPLRARQDASKGKVTISFIVEKNGELKDVKLVHGIGYPYDDEALRLLKSSPAWKPATLADKPVRALVTMPVTFKQ